MRCSFLVLLSIWLNSWLFTSPCPAADAGSVAKQPLSKPLSTTKGLLIVAPQRFEGLLRPYVRHKQKQLPTRIESLERILKNTPGVDDPERLKRFLFHQWQERHIGYVLLVGDADILPVRYMVLDRITPAAFDYAFYPSDLYYSDIARADGSFDDWNARKEDFHSGYFGEVRGEKNKKDPINFDQIDYRPDIAVGRWPVSTADEVRLIAEEVVGIGNCLNTASHLSDGDNTIQLGSGAFKGLTNLWHPYLKEIKHKDGSAWELHRDNLEPQITWE